MFCRVKHLRLCDCIKVREEVVVTACRATIPILPTLPICLAIKIFCGGIFHVAFSVSRMKKTQGKVLVYPECVISFVYSCIASR